jgi:hypothetical protein
MGEAEELLTHKAEPSRTRTEEIDDLPVCSRSTLFGEEERGGCKQVKPF